MNPWNLTNAVLFQGAWFACVLGGAQGTSLWGAGVLTLLFAFSLLRNSTARDLVIASVAAALGFLLDTLWIRTGVLNYQGAAVAPVWIVMLWVGVGLSINHSLSTFKARPWLGGVLAGALAPVSYLAGERFGAVSVPHPWQLGIISLIWLMLFTVGFWLAGEGEEPDIQEGETP